MKTTFDKRFLKPFTVLLVAAFALAPIAEARPGGGGGGGHMGGGGRPGGGHAGGGGGRPGGGAGNRPQVNNVNRDVRANNVRNTSVNNVNNVNVNRNVVVANNNRGGYHGGWDNDYHPVATAAAVTATVAVTSAVVGSMVRSVPAGCVPVNYGGLIYQQCGSTWYQPQNGAYVVINAPY
jgi:hypothetical protein